MKYLYSLAVFICLHLTTIAQTEKNYDPSIEVHFNETPLNKAFNQMQDSGKITIGFLWEYLKYSKPVTLDTIAPLSVVLNICLRDQPLEWKWDFKPSPPMIAIIPKDVTGKVTDSVGNPLQRVSVKGDKKTTKTDRSGGYTLLRAATDSAVTFTSIDRNTIRVKLYGQTVVSIMMGLKILNLDSVVNDGYHFIPKERQTGSFTFNPQTDLEQSPSFSIIERLEGKISGFLFNYPPNNYTNEPLMQMRGQSSIYANTNVLVVVDGNIFTGDIRMINPNNVVSISILHDAAAASVWGTKAGNGVIVITTKKAKFSQPFRIHINSNFTIMQKKNLFYMYQFSPKEFSDLEKYRFDSSFYGYLSPNGTSQSNNIETLEAFNNKKISGDQKDAVLAILENHDVRDDLKKYFYRTGISQQQYVNVSKGKENFSYNFSGCFNREKANEVNTLNEQVSLGGGISYKFKSLELLTYNFASWSKNVNNGRLPSTYYPNSFLVDSFGRAAVVPSDIRQPYKDSINKLGILPDWNLRPLDELQENKLLLKQNNQLFNLNIKYTLINKIVFELCYQLHLNNDEITDYNSPNSYTSRHLYNSFAQVDNNTITSYPVPKGGILNWQRNSFLEENGRFQVSWDFGNPNRLRFFGLAGIEFNKIRQNSSSGIYYGYYPDQTQEVKVDFTTKYKMFYDPSQSEYIPNHSSIGSAFDYRASRFANVGFSYIGRYNFTASIRTDESNLFGPNAKSKKIPLGSLGVKWDLNEEPGLKRSWLSYLNLRGSIGTSGNINNAISAYVTADRAPINRLGQSPVTIITPNNNYIRWERSSMTNIALEWADINRLFQFTFEYFWRDSRYLVAPSLQDPTYGYTNYWDNKARMRGQGFDFSLITNVASENLKFSNLFWLSLATSKVTRFENPQTQARFFVDNRYLSPREGSPVYAVNAYKWAGLDPSTGAPRVYLSGNVSEDYKKINDSSPDSSLINFGSSIPVLFGAINPSIQFKRISAYITIVGKFKYYFKRSSVNYSDPYTVRLAGSNDFSNRWRQPGDEKNTNVPSLIIWPDNDRDNTYSNSSILVEKGDNIKLKSIKFEFDLGKRLARQIGVKRITTYTIVDNVVTIWKATKTTVDPDYLTVVPNPRSYTLGINIDL